MRGISHQNSIAFAPPFRGSSIYEAVLDYLRCLFDLYPKLNAGYRNLIESRKALFLGLFKKFKEQRIFMEDVDENLFPLLFEQFFIISDNWVKYARMQAEKDPINHYVGLSVALFLPFFKAQIKMDALRWIKSNGSKTT